MTGRYGGRNATSWVSVVIGWLTALGASLILTGIVAGIVGLLSAGGGSGQQAGVVGGLIALFLAFFVGGYTAGRLAARSGTKHGLLVALLAFVVTLMLALLGDAVGVGFMGDLRSLTLPGVPQIAEQGLNAVLTLSTVLALLLPFVAGAIGGSRGATTGSRRP